MFAVVGIIAAIVAGTVVISENAPSFQEKQAVVEVQVNS